MLVRSNSELKVDAERKKVRSTTETEQTQGRDNSLVGNEVLDRRRHSLVLKSVDESGSKLSGEKRVLRIGLEASSAERVPLNVDG